MEQKENLHGFPFDYGDELTPEMAGKNRNRAVCSSVLILNIWLRFGKPIQSDSSCLNVSNEPDKAIVRIVETSNTSRMDSINRINRGGDFSKSGPGARAKSDAFKTARKTGGGSIFAQGLTPQQHYGSRPIRPIHKPLSCRKAKITDGQVNGNKNPGGSETPKNQNMPRETEISQYIPEFGCSIENIQLQKKFKHAKVFGVTGDYNLKNGQLFKDKIIEHIKNPSTQVIEGTYRNVDVTHYFNPKTKLNVMFNRTDNKFISGWRLNPDQLKNIQNRGEL